MNIVIFGGSVIFDYEYIKKYINKYSYIICADSGLEHIEKLSISPDTIIGDMDSVDNNLLDKYKNKNINIKKYPKDKDKTDTEICIDFALTLNPTMITLLGVIGGRIDHFLSVLNLSGNIARENIKSLIADETNEIYTIFNDIKIKKDDKTYISIIPISEKVSNVTIKGTKYLVENKTIYRNSSYTISNEFAEDEVEICIKNQGLYVIKTKK